MVEHKIAAQLESQVDEMLSLYDTAEKLHSYQSLHGERVLNEDERRKNMVAFATSKGQSENIYNGAVQIGLLSTYLWSRRGASSIFDLSKMRACGWTTASVFMLGTTLGAMMCMNREAIRLDQNSQNINTSVRLLQNEQTHALLRTMKFHLATRQMSIWDQDPR